MTSTQTPPLPFLHSVMTTLRQAVQWCLHGLLALTLILFAGMIAIATAAAGLALALVALIVRLMDQRPIRNRAQKSDQAETVTLEARRTPKGWTVE